MITEIIKKNKSWKYDKIFHISDIHIRNTEEHIGIYSHVFENLYKYLQTVKSDKSLIVITGDILHNKNKLTTVCETICVDFFEKLSSIMTTIIIPGNHDFNEKANTIEDSLSTILYKRDFDNLHYLKLSGVYRFNNILFGVSSLIDNKIIKATDISEPGLKIALYHGAVANSKNSKGFEFSKNSITNFDGYDLVLLGDIHYFQYLNEEKTMAYASSLISQNFSETDSNHGVLVWDLNTKESVYKPIPNDYRYDEITIKDNKLMHNNKNISFENLKLPANGKLKINSLSSNIDFYNKTVFDIKSTYPNLSIVHNKLLTHNSPLENKTKNTNVITLQSVVDNEVKKLPEESRKYVEKVLLKEIKSIKFEVIFTTSHADYAIKAIKADALDYLIKPINLKDLSNAIRRFENKKIVGFAMSEKSDDTIDMVFNKKRADDRKDWLKLYDRSSFIDTSKQIITYDEFIHKELIHFSKYDCDRSIPNLMDGLKISLRKILFSAFKKNLTTEIKVAQFSGYVSEHSGYHHGEASLQGAIINMAQNFCGSNNINLLYPSGQFGSRIKGGQDSSSPRYLFTRLERIARCIFPEQDDNILTYLTDDGISVEPQFYVPIIPMALVNGTKGIGTGFSTEIMCYNPRDIIAYLKNKLLGLQDKIEFSPFYDGFTGTTERVSDTKFVFKGRYEKIDANKIRVTELPVGFWTDSFKELCMYVGTKKSKEIKKYYIPFDVHFNKEGNKIIADYFLKVFNR